MMAGGEGDASVALYRQLVSTLIEYIGCNLRAGDRVPSERELAGFYGVARGTVRLALDELEAMGIIVREQGRGTFVAERKGSDGPRCPGYRLGENLKERGCALHTRTLLRTPIVLEGEPVGLLGCAPGAEGYRWMLLHEMDDKPVMLEDAYLLRSRFPGCERADVGGRELPEIIDMLAPGMVRSSCEQVRAVVADGEDVRLLDVGPGTPLVQRDIVYEDAAGAPVACARAHLVSSAALYSVRFTDDGGHVSRV